MNVDVIQPARSNSHPILKSANRAVLRRNERSIRSDSGSERIFDIAVSNKCVMLSTFRERYKWC